MRSKGLWLVSGVAHSTITFVPTGTGRTGKRVSEYPSVFAME